MQIHYIQDMEQINNTRHGDWLDHLKYQKYNSFSFEQRRWSEEPLVIHTNQQDENSHNIYQCNFVGIIWYENRLILALPKAVTTNQEEQNVNDAQILMKYADLLDKYFTEVRTIADYSNGENRKKSKKFEPIYPWCIDHLADWCRKMVDSEAVLPTPQVIAAVKFEKVFEWMLGKLFNNQIFLKNNRVIFKSQILSEIIDINDSMYNIYTWKPVGKRNVDNHTLESRDVVFSDQQKKNIPDIVTEIALDEPKIKKCCCVIDAKYSGWNKGQNCYKLPGNMDIYKQFFYQEQLLHIYENAGQNDVLVYNFLILPDHINDTGDKLLRLCAEINFRYHEEQSISVLQINMDALIDICACDNQSLIEEKNQFMAYMLTNYKKVVPMRSQIQMEGSNSDE